MNNVNPVCHAPKRLTSGADGNAPCDGDRAGERRETNYPRVGLG